MFGFIFAVLAGVARYLESEAAFCAECDGPGWADDYLDQMFELVAGDGVWFMVTNESVNGHAVHVWESWAFQGPGDLEVERVYDQRIDLAHTYHEFVPVGAWLDECDVCGKGVDHDNHCPF